MAKFLLAALVMFLVSILLSPVQPQEVPNFLRCTGTNYTAGSLYKSNLESLLQDLKSLPSTTTRGYYKIRSWGIDGSDAVYGLVQCRGDVSQLDCASCLNRSVEEALFRCQGRREAAILFDLCILRYNSTRFFGTINVGEMKISYISNKSSEPDLFEQHLGEVLILTIGLASQDNSRFAIGIKNFSDTTVIYGQAECTRDLSNQNCLQCLGFLFQNHMPGRLAGQVHAASCTMRYAAEPFISLPSLPPTLPPIDPPGGIIPTPPSPTAPASPDDPPPAIPPPHATPGLGPSPGRPSLAGEKSKISRISIIFIVIGGAVFLFVVAIFYLRRKAIRKYFSIHGDQGAGTAETLHFNFAVLKAATGNFCEENKLGQGGFGPVYWGLLPDGRQIAVKRLSRTSAQGINELKNEVLLMSKLFHRNLARFFGFCFEEEEKIVVYEYLPNQSLDKFLFDPERRSQLNWETRFKMIEGIARGLLYLHDDSRLRIIHRDLKASNILLDGDMIAKISDFGLARLFPMDETHISTSQIAGTQGYMAPEYLFHGQFSTKSDVFSFGVLVLEIVTGRRNAGPRGSVINYVWNHWVQGTSMQVIDQSIENETSTAEAMRCVHVGLLCIQSEPSARPSMSNVCLMLNSFSVSLQAPSSPAFHLNLSVDSHQATPDYEISSSELDPR